MYARGLKLPTYPSGLNLILIIHFIERIRNFFVANPNPKHKYTSPYEKEMAESPISVRLEAEIDKFVRSLPNRTEWLREAIAAAYERDKQQQQ